MSEPGMVASPRQPKLLTRNEVSEVLSRMYGPSRIAGMLMYGAGLRLLECLQLRVKDVDFGCRQIVVREGTGSKDRVTILPSSIEERHCNTSMRSRRCTKRICRGAGVTLDFRMDWIGNIRRPSRSGAGSGYFRQRGNSRMPVPGACIVTTSTKRFSSGP